MNSGSGPWAWAASPNLPSGRVSPAAWAQRREDVVAGPAHVGEGPVALDAQVLAADHQVGDVGVVVLLAHVAGQGHDHVVDQRRAVEVDDLGAALGEVGDQLHLGLGVDVGCRASRRRGPGRGCRSRPGCRGRTGWSRCAPGPAGRPACARSWYWSKIFGKSPLASIISMVLGTFTSGRGPAVARMVSDCSNSRRPVRWLSSFIFCLAPRRPCRRVDVALDPVEDALVALELLGHHRLRLRAGGGRAPTARRCGRRCGRACSPAAAPRGLPPASPARE